MARAPRRRADPLLGFGGQFRATFSVMPQYQAPNRSGSRSRSRLTSAAMAASWPASAARSGDPSTRAASAIAAGQWRLTSSANASRPPAAPAAGPAGHPHFIVPCGASRVSRG